MNLYLSGWRHALKFKGRASRAAYWAFVLVNMAISLVLAFTVPQYALIWTCICGIPFLSIMSRRLIDAGKSEFWVALPVVISTAGYFAEQYATEVSGSSLAMITVTAYFLTMVCIIVIGSLPGVKEAEPDVPKE